MVLIAERGYNGFSLRDLASTPQRIVPASGEEYAADAVILAMGAAPRPLGIPHEDELRGKGISYCATCSMRLLQR